MKQRWVTGLICALLVGMVGGFSQAQDVKLVWTWCCGQEDRRILFEELAKIYSDQTPGVTVQAIYPSGSYPGTLQTWVAGGTQLDIAWVGANMWALPYEPLDRLVEMSPDIKRVFPSMLEKGQWLGQQITIPYGANSHTLAYNKGMFDEAGLAHPTSEWTWNEAVEMARAMSRDSDGDGRLDQAGMRLLTNYSYIYYGGDAYSEDGRRIRLADPVNAASIKMYVDITQRLGIHPAADDTGLRFGNGNVGIEQLGIFQIPQFREQASFEWDVVELPALEYEGERYRQNFVSMEAWGILQTSEHKEESMDFLLWLMGEEAMTRIAQSGIVIPTSAAVAHHFLAQAPPPANLEAFINAFDFGNQKHIDHPIGAEVHSHLVNQQIYGQMWAGEMAPETALPELERQVNVLLDEYWAKQE